MFFFQVFTIYGMFMFSNTLKEMSGCVPNIICIAQITFGFVNNTMLVKKGRFFLNRSDVISDFPAGKHWAQITYSFLAKLTDSSLRSLRTVSADLWSLKGKTILMGSLSSWISCWLDLVNG